MGTFLHSRDIGKLLGNFLNRKVFVAIMTMKQLSVLFFFFVLVSLFPAKSPAGEDGGWYACAYWAQATRNRLATITIDTDYIDSHLAALAVGKVLIPAEKYASLEAEFQVVKHLGKEFSCNTEACERYAGETPKYSDKQDHFEFNAVLILKWHYFPWDKYIDTSFSVGEGFSYATQEPPIEKDYHNLTFGGDTETSQFLNYLLFELAFVVPKLDDWSVFARIHHRSGIYGLINGINGGSNFVGAGVRYDF